MKFTTKQLAQTGLLLALCIASQFFKNLSVYITGPIVNTIIIIAVLSVGLFSGIIISIIAPITAFLITSSPIIAAIPAIMPVIMLGNCILAVFVWLFNSKIHFKLSLPTGMIIGSVIKSIFMAVIIINVLFTMFGGALNDKQLAMGKTTFSTVQLITALIGSVLAYLIWIPLKKYLKNANK